MESAIDYKPLITAEESVNLVESLYGVKCSKIVELNGYDDKNYRIFVDNIVDNKFVDDISIDGYVLKIMNSLESQKTTYVDAQIQMMLHLVKNGFNCPVPIKNIHGHYYSLEKFNETAYVVRLLKYQPGTIFYEVPMTSDLFFQIGEYIAKLDESLKNFHHEALQSHNSVWMLNSLPEIKNYKHVIKEETRLQLVDEITQAFELNVLTKLGELETGVIHGDFNEQNIIMRKHDENSWKISAVLDFGDINLSYYLFELAITLTYAMLQSKDIDSGGYVIAGYSTVRKIPTLEYSLLKNCIAARLVQSLVLGAYAHKKNPTNTYVLTTQAYGWAFLENFWAQSSDSLLKSWDDISAEYISSLST